jgi:hypothetical protein
VKGKVISLGLLSVALAGCASGPWSVPDTEYVTVPPKVHVKYIVKPAPTVTVTKTEKLPQSCVNAVKYAQDVSEAALDIQHIRFEMDQVTQQMPVAAMEDDIKTITKAQQSLNDLAFDLRASTTFYAQSKTLLDKMQKQCKEDGGMP